MQNRNPTRVVPGLHFASEHFPVSSTFALFLELAAFGKSSIPPNLDWGDQITEKMHGPGASLPEFRQIVRDAANRAFNTPVGRDLTMRAYNLFGDLLVGNPGTLANLQKRRHIFVVSAPRHGGSYLTKELYRATGIDPSQVPNYIAHDGFPDCSPNWYTSRDGQDVPATRTTIQQTAEWLVMADYFFREQLQRPVDGLPTLVKKATKMVYMGNFFRETFGPLAEWVVIVRHPVPACVSLYEKAGGVPEDGLFPARPRSVIERWVFEAWERDGVPRTQVAKKPYFTAYLHYWMRYHQALATGGLLRPNGQRLTLLPYDPEQIEDYVRGQLRRFGVAADLEPEHFHTSDKAWERHPDWVREAEETVRKVEKTLEHIGVQTTIPRQ
ncbi:hypothetical protein [Acidithiobacillus caldus]|uniref:Sulfotransferase n=1 Tax=Acidithiobacillus caldus TaxID=33059 RepID=A0A1E7YQ59_9PROT|nr:hypothetical protein [Acidithiobacillus caldus]OFC38291.1 hypothetical protein BAE27_02325 [Acidithiobacillus caldus]OFC40160.1 hypothetical protein BAE28_01260 [Acidithiobacillus caldus]OFC41843.1 hypothetical protein BAE29_01700 [Acidithiobacillus caldus]